MSGKQIVLGRFTLQHRVIECYRIEGGPAASVRLRRNAPEPSIELGYLNRLGHGSARLHLYRAEWGEDLRREATVRAARIWSDTDHGEPEAGSRRK